MCTAALIGWGPAIPPSPRIWTRYTRALLVSKDRRHILVAPCCCRRTGRGTASALRTTRSSTSAITEVSHLSLQLSLFLVIFSVLYVFLFFNRVRLSLYSHKKQHLPSVVFMTIFLYCMSSNEDFRLFFDRQETFNPQLFVEGVTFVLLLTPQL